MVIRHRLRINILNMNNAMYSVEIYPKTRAHLYVLLVLVRHAADLADLRRYEKSCSRLSAPKFSFIEMVMMNMGVRPMNLPARQTWYQLTLSVRNPHAGLQ